MEYSLVVSKTLVLMEWFPEDLICNSLVSEPANETCFSYFSKNEEHHKCTNCKNNHKVFFSVFNEEKRVISGLMMKSGVWIPRSNANGEGDPGYIYFSRDSIRRMKDLFGNNRKMTWQHSDEITGDLILLDSFIIESSDCTEWHCSYKVLTERLWSYIKEKKVVGFSIEAMFSQKKLDKFAKQVIRSLEDIEESDLDNTYQWVMTESGKEHCPVCQGFNGQQHTLRQWFSIALPRVPQNSEKFGLIMSGQHEPYNTYCEMDCNCYLRKIKI